MSNSEHGLTKEEKAAFVRSRKNRNIAMGLCLIAFILMLYFVTMFKLGSNLFI